MKKGYLSQYFDGVAAKYLSVVETDGKQSNQHEFNATTAMKKLFGESRRKFKALFMYLHDDEQPTVSEGSVTWYDAREHHPTRSEYRLFYTSNDVLDTAKAGDVMFIGLKQDESLMLIIADGDSAVASQLAWLFNIVPGNKFVIKENLDDRALNFSAQYILRLIGIDIQENADSHLDEMIRLFGVTFPSTKKFSDYARSTVKNVNPLEDPDSTLMAWFIQEDKLFHTFEKNVLKVELTQMGEDVERFFGLAKSAMNRRYSRAGSSFENHIEEILRLWGIRFDRTKITENTSKPDFLFPGVEEYHDPLFPIDQLDMLGAKTTCKDRWRQVIDEADKIKKKHLITLEPSISVYQTDQMKARNLQLVVPNEIQTTYTSDQQNWLMSFEEFLSYVKERQKCG